MKIVFMGTPDFAVPALEKLTDEHEVVCVYTRAPKEAGRGKKETKTPVHLFAEAQGIEVRTPRSLRSEDEQKAFKMLNADVAVVAAYGLILPLPILEAFPYGCLNIHASLLPRWRGAAPIQRCIEAGDKVAGVTIMQIAEGLDTGDMLLKGQVEITPRMSGGLLHDELSELGAKLMLDALRHIDTLKPEPQNDALACYAAKIEKEESRLNFECSAQDLEYKIRAFNPYPATFFEYEGERFKVLSVEVRNEGLGLPVGSLVVQDGKLLVVCKKGVLDIKQIQRQGKKAMSTQELLRGFDFVSGCVLR